MLDDELQVHSEVGVHMEYSLGWFPSAHIMKHMNWLGVHSVVTFCTIAHAGAIILL